MKKPSAARLAALAVLLAAATALGAQQAPAVQLAFGFECGDRFLVKNDGSAPVTLEWKATGSADRSQLHLGANESREIASASNDAVELYVNGKVVATEPKGTKACDAANASGTAPDAPMVVVRPLDGQSADASPQAAGDPPSRVARLSSMQGGVSFQAAGSAEWGTAMLNSSLTTGDRLVSDDDGRAELEVGGVAARFGSSADVTVTSLTDGLFQLGVAAGTLRLSVYRMNAGDTIEVDTPNGAVTMLTPGNVRIETNSAGTQTLVSVERGRVELNGPNLSQVLDAGRTVQLAARDGGVQIVSAAHPASDTFDAWSSYRDGKLTNTASQSEAYVNPDVPGVQDLDANGRWETDADDGPIWYPTTVAVGWVPYRYGHWGWVEPWGWVWISDEPWGFAPFHYGRWAFVRNRWGWVPGPRMGRPYYSPALVAFADGSGFGVGVGVSAWFPLGPRDPYIPWYHHDDRYLRAVNRANVRGVTNIDVFVHVRDVEHFHYANRTAAMTVVPTTAFASGRPIAHEVVHVAPERISFARVTPHPGVVPTREAAIGGGAIVQRPHAAVERTAVPEPRRGGAPGSPGTPRVQPPARGSVGPGPRPLVNRAPLPPASVPFAARQKAIAEHPGRPLEPQQVQNLRAGRPAGPHRDPEPPHPRTAVERKPAAKKPAK
ncbi:MAG: DUF6600 domain-containing protein [Gemmatimonadales bacterium]